MKYRNGVVEQGIGYYSIEIALVLKDSPRGCFQSFHSEGAAFLSRYFPLTFP